MKMEGSDRVLNENVQRSPRQMLIDEVNHYATLYAQVRKKAEAEAEGRLSMEEVHAKLSNHEHLLKAWAKAFQLFKQGENEHYYYYAGKKRYDLGEDGMNFSIELFKFLNKYDPAQSKFTTYLERRVEGMSKDYFRKVQKKAENEQGGIDGGPDEEDEPSGELGENDPGYEMMETISMFGKFSEVLLKHTEIVGKVRKRAETKRERFFAYHTRSYVLSCDDFADYVSSISMEVEKTLSQPYILYLLSETVNGNEDAKRHLYTLASKGRVFHVGAIRLKELYMSQKLISERYEEKKAMNIYFGRTNLSEEMQEYDELLSMFLGRRRKNKAGAVGVHLKK